MDTSAVNVNVTVDDFDSVVSYPDQSVWQTPDPSSSTFTAVGSPWWMGTYHKTDVVDASFSFNFTGKLTIRVASEEAINISKFYLDFLRSSNLHLRPFGATVRLLRSRA